MSHSDYIVYVDESGDHGLQSTDPNYPIFVLAFCIFEKSVYVRKITPSVQEFKFKHFGHDMIVLHSHEIRKTEGSFKFLINAERRAEFIADMNTLMQIAEFKIIASVIRKDEFKGRFGDVSNPYHIAMKFGLEQLDRYLKSKNQHDGTTFVVFESRGKKEDDELELEFRRVCDGNNDRNQSFPFSAMIANKQINSCGLQLADLVARPIGLKILRPDQPNRAYDIIEPKIHRNPAGEIRGWGLKIYP